MILCYNNKNRPCHKLWLIMNRKIFVVKYDLKIFGIIISMITSTLCSTRLLNIWILIYSGALFGFYYSMREFWSKFRCFSSSKNRNNFQFGKNRTYAVGIVGLSLCLSEHESNFQSLELMSRLRTALCLG